MPKQITTTITINDLQLDAITIAFPQGPGQPMEVTASYRLLRADGTTHEVKRVGGMSLPPGITAAMLQGWWAQLLAARKTAEGV